MISNIKKYLRIVSAAFVAICITTLTACSATKPVPPEGTYGNDEPDFNTPVAFNPPQGVRIERSMVMRADGHDIGKIYAVRQRDADSERALIRDDVTSKLELGVGIFVSSKETLWISENGMQKYQGEISETGKKDPVYINAELQDDVLNYEYKNSSKGKTHLKKFKQGEDYHWSTVYLAMDNRELKRGKMYERKLIDMAHEKRARPVREQYLGTRPFKVGDKVLTCHVLWFDYGHLNGTAWVAKDEMGWFLVYEEADATEGKFELILDGYKKTVDGDIVVDQS